MFQMMGVFAEFERAMIRERVLAGLARAKQDGIHLGRKFTEDTKDGNRKIKAALAMRAKGVGIRKSGGSCRSTLGLGNIPADIPKLAQLLEEPPLPPVVLQRAPMDR